MITYSYLNDGSISFGSQYSDELFKELFRQCSSGKFYVPNSFRHNPLANAAMKVTVSPSDQGYPLGSGDTYSLVAIDKEGKFKLVCHDPETFVKVFSGLIFNMKFEYVEGSVKLAPANYTCELKDSTVLSKTIGETVSFDVNSEPDTEPSKDFDINYALGISRKQEFVDYVKSFGIKIDESLSLKKLKNVVTANS